MIQRIQTVYLALVFIFSSVGLFSTIGEWMVADSVVAHFSSFTFGADGAYKALDSASGPWGLGILLVMVMFLSLISIMLFRKRMRQLRLTILSTILLVGYLATYAFIVYQYGLKIEDAVQAAPDLAPVFHLPFMALFPVISIILNCLAIHGIRKDEALVRSLDRIR